MNDATDGQQCCHNKPTHATLPTALEIPMPMNAENAGPVDLNDDSNLGQPPAVVLADPGTERVFEMVGGVKVRALRCQGKPWFVAKDVCVGLELNNSRRALMSLPERMKGVTLSNTLGGRQKVQVVNVPGYFLLIGKSRKPAAVGFQIWVAEVVLPALMEKGTFSMRPEAPTGVVPERERLWAAYDRALSPEIQATILNAMGYPLVTPAAQGLPTVQRSRAIQHPPVPAGEVLAAWEAALTTGQLAVSATWIRRYGEYLAVVPARLMALPGFQAWNRGAVRAGLQSHPSWQSLVFVPGRHKLRVRFAGVGHPLHCWLFQPEKLPEGLRAALAGAPS